MNNRIASSVFIIATFLFQSGCTSYSFRGAHSNPPAKAPVVQQYRLSQYSSDIDSSLTPWSVPRFAGKQVSKRDIERTLISAYPDRFVRSEDAVPVDVKVRCVKSKCNAWGLVTYFLTLGIYPANIIQYHDLCDVTVSVNGHTNKGGVKFRSNAWLSVWTPFGLSRTDSQDEYNGAHGAGSGIFAAPHMDTKCYNKQNDVYIAEIAAEINSGVAKLDQVKSVEPPRNPAE